MITIKTRDEVELMRKANLIDRDCLMMLGEHVKPGITTKELDTLAREYIEKHNAVPSFLGFEGFPGSICASVNEAVVHGIPSKKKYLEDGDIISIDIPNRKLELEVSDEELAKRRANWKKPEPKIKTGYLARYAKMTSSASTGAVVNA